MPAAAVSAVATIVVSCVLFTNVVARALPFQFTTEAEKKAEPFTVSVKAASPAVALVGERDVTAGTGKFTMKLKALVTPPPGAGVNTVMEFVHPPARSLARMVARSWVELTNVVARSEPLNRTTETELKYAPFTVSMKPTAPAVASVGETVVMFPGVRFRIMKG